MDHVQQLRNLKDFLLVYNRMTEICFQRCTTNFNYRALTMDEERCVDSCAGKLIRSNHRLMGTYVQLMPGMVQRRMEEMEKKAAELDKAEAQAAASTEAPVPAVPAVPMVPELAPAATDTPVGLVPPDVTVPVLPDVTVPVLATDAQPAVFVSDATDAVPHLPAIVIPAADVPVANGPSLNEGAGNGAPPFVLPPILAPELPGPVGPVPSVAEPSSAEAKLAAPIAVEGPIAPISAPLISSIPLPELSLGSSEEKIPSPVALPSTPPAPAPAPAAVSGTVPLTDFSTSVPDVVKSSSDAPAPGVSALPVPILLSDSAPGISATTVPILSSDTAPGISAAPVPIPSSDSAPGSQSSS